MTTQKGIDSYRLKLIALVFMVLDHIFSELNGPIHNYEIEALWPHWISLTTRFVSPLFLYLMVEGFYYTRSRIKYLRRLLIAGGIMLGGNVLINYIFHNVSSTGKYTFRSLIEGHNIFLTLAVLFVFIWCLENIKQKEHKKISIILAIFTAIFSIVLEGGFYLLPIAFICWLFHASKPLQCVGIGFWSLILLTQAVTSYFHAGSATSFYDYMCFNNEWAMFPVVFLILLYSGERGKNTKFTKYLFYVIYPLHLWILMIARYMILK